MYRVRDLRPRWSTKRRTDFSCATLYIINPKRVLIIHVKAYFNSVYLLVLNRSVDTNRRFSQLCERAWNPVWLGGRFVTGNRQLWKLSCKPNRGVHCVMKTVWLAGILILCLPIPSLCCGVANDKSTFMQLHPRWCLLVQYAVFMPAAFHCGLWDQLHCACLLLWANSRLSLLVARVLFRCCCHILAIIQLCNVHLA